MFELIAGLLVASAAVVLVLEPLWRRHATVAPDLEPELVDPEESESPKVQALLALRELEFDLATGKLSQADYERLKARYSRAAVEAIKAEKSAEDGADDGTDPAERAIAAAKGFVGAVCPSCGPRPESNAVYCSSCGRSLVVANARARCADCGADLPRQATFCAACGHEVASKRTPSANATATT